MDSYNQTKKKYTYKDNKLKLTAFEFVGFSIEDADNAYETEFGVHPKNERNIGCSVKIVLDIQTPL